MLLQPWLAGVFNRLIGRRANLSPRRKKSAHRFGNGRLPSQVQVLETRALLSVNIVVDSLLDSHQDGHTTLREAITRANSDSPGDTISFDDRLAGGTIMLTGGEISITNSMQIFGVTNLTVSGINTSRIFDAYNASSLDEPQVLIEGLAFIKGNGVGLNNSGLGGAIYNSVSLTLLDDYFQLNKPSRIGTTEGGAIASYGTLMSNHVVFANNSADVGGAVWTFRNSLTSSNDTFDGNKATNYGGAIAADSFGTVSSSNDTFDSNSAPNGGAIYLTSKTTLSTTSDTFSNNVANSQFNATGGAISVNETTDGGAALTSIGDTFSNNSAGGPAGEGGAVYVNSTVPMKSVNDTFYANSAYLAGGGIFFQGGFAQAPVNEIILNDTIVGNSTTEDSDAYGQWGGGGIGSLEANSQALFTLTAHNTLLVGNTSNGRSSDLAELGFPYTFGGLIGDINDITSGDSFTLSALFNNDSNGKPLLANNGAETQSIALANGSAAIGAGVALTNLPAAINATTTSITVASAEFIVVGEQLRIDSEIVRVTGISGTTVTVLRGQANTVAASHARFASITLANDQTGLPAEGNDLGARAAKHVLVVNSPSDTPLAGETTLRQATTIANSDDPPVTITGNTKVIQGGDTISFAPGLTGIITLTQGPLLITNAMTIQGPGTDKLTIATSGNSPVFAVNSGDPDVFDQVSLQNLGISGTVTNQGNLLLSNVAFTGVTSLVAYPTNPLTSIFAPYNGALATLVDDTNTTGDTTPYSATISWDNGAPSNQVSFTSTGNSGFDVSDPIVFSTAGTHTYHIAITDNNGDSTTVDGTLLVATSSHEYFVNAGSTGGQYSTTGGSNTNSGISRDQPMADLSALINAYHPHAGDTIFVDAGTYHLLTDIVLGAQDSGVTIVGPTDPSAGAAILDRGNTTSSDAFVFDIVGATDVTLSHLSMTDAGGAAVNLPLAAGSDRITVDACDIYGTNENGGPNGIGAQVAVFEGSTDFTLENSIIHDSVSSAVWVGGGFYFAVPARSVISNNDIFGNRGGITAAGGALTGSDVIAIRGNTVHDNAGAGIAASGGVLVTGNKAYGESGGDEAGFGDSVGFLISDNSEADNNVAYGNVHGIDVLYGGAVSCNEVYGNSETGIVMGPNSTAAGNSVYDNPIGIDVSLRTGSPLPSAQVLNNLVYDNQKVGIRLLGASSTELDNNTVYQPTGDAVQAESTSGLRLRNNILWVGTGSDLDIDKNSQVGFDSDYNDLYATGSGVVGTWQGESVTNLAAWAYSLMQDRHSLSTDPQFATGGFQLQSTSPAIDAGDPSSSYSAEPAPNGGRVNLGYTGNTADANTSATPLLQVLVPIGLDKFQVGVPTTITWRSDGLTSSATVAVDVSTDGGSTWTTLATGVGLDSSGNGSLSWTPTVENDSTPLPSTLIRVRSDDGQGAMGESAPFLIANGGHDYYVSPGGNDVNSGKSSDQPMADLSALINAYHPHAGDTIHVAPGTYHLLTDIVLGAQDSGVTIVGPTDPSAGAAILDRGNTSSSANVFDVVGATDVTLSHLALTGAGGSAVSVPDSAGSDRLTIDGCDMYGNADNTNGLGQVQIDVGNANFVLENSLIHDTLGSKGVNVFGVGLVINNEIYSNGGEGIDASGTVMVEQNTVYDNVQTGISARGSGTLVTNNTVYGERSLSYLDGVGIILDDGAQAQGNVAYNNASGMAVGSDSVAIGNDVHDNSDSGIQVTFGNATIRGNSVHDNLIGIEVQDRGKSAQILNNLVYDNTQVGVYLSGSINSELDNNTIYQPLGDAVQATNGGSGGTSGLRLRNNILWVGTGSDLNIDKNSQVGFDSDYNDLYTTGSGVVGTWQGQSVTNLAAWAYSLLQDRHSLSTDPQFAAGGFQLQNTSPAIDAGDPSSPYSAEPAPNGGRVNLGYTGNTADANTSATPLLQVLVPIGLDKFQVGVPTTITWRSDGLTSSATVAVDVSTDGGSTWTTLATGVGLDSSGNGSLSWTPTVENDSTPLPSTLIRVRSDDGQGAMGESAPFLIANGGHDYYVSPGGNDVNSGKSSDQPMADLSALINAYHPHAGDTIHVAPGTYHLLTDIVLGAQDSGVTIVGPTDPSAGAAILDRGNTSSSANVFDVVGATDVTLSHLALTGAGGSAVSVPDSAGSDRLTIDGCDMYGNADNTNGLGQVQIDVGNANFVLENSLIHDTLGSKGVNVFGVGLVINNEIYSNGGEGIDASGTVMVEQNTVYDNVQTGISARGSGTLVTNNTVYGERSLSYLDGVGIILDDGAQAQGNVAYNNASGMAVGSDSVAIGNDVHDNSDSGIQVTFGNATIRGNSVHDNLIGIEVQDRGKSAQILNNLVYDNTQVGVYLSGSINSELDNNTIYQPLGDAVQATNGGSGGTSGLRLRNNILWVSVGADLNIASDSQAGFDSDNNLFFVSPDSYAHLGIWGNTTVDVATSALHDWQTISSGDANSVFGDPKFVTVNKADFHLSSGSPAAGAGDPLSAPAVDYDGKLRNNTLGFTDIGAYRAPSILAAPTVPKTQAAFEGISVTNVVLGTFIDSYSSAVPGDFSLTNVNWGGILAGTPPKLSIISDPSYVGSGSGWKVVADTVTYAEKGTYPVSLNVADVAGGTITLSQTSFNVADAPLSDTTLARTINTIEGQANTNVVLMTFTDANPFAPVADFSVTNVNWVGTLAGTLPTISLVRDTSYVGTGSGWKVVADTVTYAHAGTYSVALTAKDVDGSTISTNKTSFNVASSAVLKSLVKGPLVASSSYLISGSVTASESGYNVSGVTSVGVYVTMDNKPFSATPFVTLSPGNLTFSYQGIPGHNYYFRSIAADAVGNVESKSTIDSSIFIAVPPPVTMVASATPNTANATITLNVTGSDPYAGGIASFAVYVVVNGGTRQLVGNVAAGTPDSSGVYHASITYQAAADGVSKTYGFYSVGTDISGRVEAMHVTPDVSITQTFASTPLAFTGVTIQHGLAERSFVEFVDLNFNKGGTELATLYANLVAHPGNYLQLLQRAVGSSANKTISLTGIKFSLVGTSIELDFGPTGLGGVARGSLSLANYWSSLITGDGWYKLSLDLTGSSNFSSAPYGSFERLLGDTNGDGKVDATDVNLVNSLQGISTNPNGDLNGDGVCDSTDKYLVGKSNGRSVGVNPF